jgi:hypothetical protein
MIGVRIGKDIKGFCDWCAKPQTKPLMPVVLVTPRGTFLQDVCELCAEEYADRAD